MRNAAREGSKLMIELFFFPSPNGLKAADVYVDSQRIALELERRFPEPTLFPTADAGLPLMMVNSSHARARFRAHGALLESQLADGRRFLCGDEPSLADAHAHPFVWMARAYFPEVAHALLKGFARLAAWQERVSALGEGLRTPMTAADALGIARESHASCASHVDADDPQELSSGDRVLVCPEDTRRGEVSGELIALDPGEIVVRRIHPSCGDVLVHFPRLGYRVTQAAA